MASQSSNGRTGWARPASARLPAPVDRRAHGCDLPPTKGGLIHREGPENRDIVKVDNSP
jgi:hypothetical protein